jgi:hypothetical protein
MDQVGNTTKHSHNRVVSHDLSRLANAPKADRLDGASYRGDTPYIATNLLDNYLLAHIRHPLLYQSRFD